MSPNLQGALWIIASCLAATVMTIAVKQSTATIHSAEIVFLRSAVCLVLYLPIFLWQGRAVLRSDRKGMHLLRGVIGVVAMLCGFQSLAELPLTTASVIFFSTPLFLTGLAGPMLGETIGWRRWGATLFGFAGVMVVMRPDTTGVHPAMLLALASAFLFAIMLIMGKKLSATDPPSTLLAYFFILSLIVSLPAAVPVWTWPTESEWLVLLVLGLGAAGRTYFDIRAYAVGEASAIAPFQYLRLVTIALGGWLVFAEIPDGPTIAGASMIVASTLYIAHREARRKTTAAEPAPQP